MASLWDGAATKMEFCDAVEYVGTQDLPGVDDRMQRRLFGLHTRVERGVPPPKAPRGASSDEREQFAAWAECRSLSVQEAMQEYLEIVHALCPGFVMKDDDTAEPPQHILDQLAAMGITKKGAGPPQPGLFAAVRQKGADLTRFTAAKDASALVNSRDEDGLTPLIHACDSENAAHAVALLKAGARPDDADPDAATPLHYAALLGTLPLAQILMDHGADRTLLDADGNTALKVARDNGHAAVAALLAKE
ncbi:ankyrin repeat-containing domain protein [Pelagophyceae sp. CCMP2097]|nr:ankyrin repeat-containing domain protein [Pelagophyceae sp. CCMP2097]